MYRGTWFAVALVLVLPTLSATWLALSSAAFLAEFLSGGRVRPLSAISPDLRVAPLAVADEGRMVPTDLYVAGGLGGPGLVLVHGISPLGKDDPRLASAAALLARAGFTVAIPTVSGLTAFRLRPDDARAVTATIRALAARQRAPVAVLAVSLGAGPALLATADPRAAGAVSAILVLGGYASSVELLRYTLTGAWAFQGVGGRRTVNSDAVETFARANGELLDAAGRRLVDNRDPAAFDALAADLPPPTRSLLDALSPGAALGGLRAPLFLVHGRDDPAVPFTETLRLAQASRATGRPARVVIVGSLAHVEPDERAGPTDLARLWIAFYAFRVEADRAARVTRMTGGSRASSLGRAEMRVVDQRGCAEVPGLRHLGGPRFMSFIASRTGS